MHMGPWCNVHQGSAAFMKVLCPCCLWYLYIRFSWITGLMHPSSSAVSFRQRKTNHLYFLTSYCSAPFWHWRLQSSLWFLLKEGCSYCHGGESQNERNSKCICRKCTGILQASVLGFACTGNRGGFCQSLCGDRDVSSLQVTPDCHCLPGSSLKFSICTLLKWTQSFGRATVDVAALWSALGFENFWCDICKW